MGRGTTVRLLQGPRANVSRPLRRAKATACKRKGGGDGEASETETFLQPAGGTRGPLLRAIWQVFCPTFLLGTLSLVISDAFRFAVPKLLRWVPREGWWSLNGYLSGDRGWGVQLVSLCLHLWCSGHWRLEKMMLKMDENKRESD